MAESQLTTVFGSGVNSEIGKFDWINARGAEKQEIFVPNPAYCNLLPTLEPFSDYLIVTQCNFSIPSYSIISEISIGIKCYATSGRGEYIRDKTVSLVKNGTLIGNNKATITQWPSTYNTKYYNYKMSDWGVNLTPSDVNSSDFGIALQVELISSLLGWSAYVDGFELRISYDLVPAIIIDDISLTKVALSPTANRLLVADI